MSLAKESATFLKEGRLKNKTRPGGREAIMNFLGCPNISRSPASPTSKEITSKAKAGIRASLHLQSVTVAGQRGTPRPGS